LNLSKLYGRSNRSSCQTKDYADSCDHRCLRWHRSCFCSYLCSERFDLVLIARSQAQLELLAAELRHGSGRTVLIISQDLSEPGAAEKVFEEIGRSGLAAGALVNNADCGTLGRFWEEDRQQQLKMI
jgi:short-subunit dehydrogenase